MFKIELIKQINYFLKHSNSGILFSENICLSLNEVGLIDKFLISSLNFLIECSSNKSLLAL